MLNVSKLTKNYSVDYIHNGRRETCVCGPNSCGPFPNGDTHPELLQKVSEAIDLLVAEDPADRYLVLTGREQLALALADAGTLEDRVPGLDGMEQRWRDEDETEDETELLAEFAALKQRAVENDYVLRGHGYSELLHVIFNTPADELNAAKIEQLEAGINSALWHIQQQKNGLAF